MKIKQQFCVFFLTTSAIFLFITSTITYYYSKKMLLEEKYSQLESISQTKKNRLEDLLQRKYRTVKLISRIIQSNSQISKKNGAVLPRENGFIDPIKKHKNDLRSITNVYLLNKDGIIIEAFEDSQIGRLYIPKDTSYWTSQYWFPDRSRGPYIEGFSRNNKNQYLLTIGCPVYYDHMFIGTTITDIVSSDIVSLTTEYTGLGETGETILAKKNKTVTLIAPTRFNKDTLHPLSGNAANDKYALYHTFLGKDGILLDHRDYREEKVIASMRFIKETNWGLLTKIDKKEAMKPVHSLQRILLLTNLIGLSILLFAALAAGDYFTRPIKKLIKSVNDIKDGDFSKRIQVDSKNEIGTLADAFNEMAERLEKKMRELKLSNESLNKFAYIITHDLKSPAISVSALAKILKEEYSNKILDENGQQILDMMTLKTQNMHELIEGVLSSAKKGYNAKDKEWIDTHSLLQNVMDNLSPPPHISINVKSQLPKVKYNKVSLIQIFQNLLSNAIKYINKPVGLIEIGELTLEGKHQFYIKDNGPGISEADYGKIFLMFESTTDQKVESHGIGLSIVKKIITENNGEIWLESELDKGTTFYFTIPIAD